MRTDCIFRVLLGGLLLPVIAGCAAQQNAVESQVQIRPQRIYEKCVQMSSEQLLQFSFSASKPVDFNIHYHHGDNIVSPIEKTAMASWEGEMDYPASTDSETICLMWKNPHEAIVSLEYDVVVVKVE